MSEPHENPRDRLHGLARSAQARRARAIGRAHRARGHLAGRRAALPLRGSGTGAGHAGRANRGGDAAGRAPRVLEAAGDRVLLGIAGPDFDSIGDAPLDGEIYLVFTLREGRIVRIHDYRTRDEARVAAGLP